jgi:predicted glycogen debranching enzyme
MSESEFLNNNIYAGYASYDLLNGNTRKYHGLLVVSENDFTRHVILSSLAESLQIGEQKYDFSNNSFLNQKEAQGRKYLVKTYLLPVPTQIYRIKGVVVEKRIIVSEDSQSVEVNYTVKNPEEIELNIAPLLNMRTSHEIGLKLTPEQVITHRSSGNIAFELHDMQKKFTLQLTDASHFEETVSISKDHYYQKEQERGYESTEDLLSPGKFSWNLEPGVHKISLKFSTSIKLDLNRATKFAQDILNPIDNHSLLSDVTRFRTLYPWLDEDLTEFLVYNARLFTVKTSDRYSIVAGYHWFAEWSRDTFIAFKGILLGLGRFMEARRVLLDWSTKIKDGLLPNRIEDDSYNSLDGILWFAVAVWHYWCETEDTGTIRKLLPKLEEAIQSLSSGSKFGIQVNKKGYLIWKDNAEALTWIDAKIDGTPVINRSGAAIDIQALWYNLLQITEKLALINNYQLKNLQLIDSLEKLLEQNFEADFWLEEKGYYADSISVMGEKRIELRPNQLMIFALPYKLAKIDHIQTALRLIDEKLLTDMGLRTLSPDEAQFNDDYKGDQRSRDLIYHQGIVWPWLLILYGNVLAGTHFGERQELQQKLDQVLEKFWNGIQARKLNHIPELFVSSNLHADGALAQAWSTAALIELVMIRGGR